MNSRPRSTIGKITKRSDVCGGRACIGGTRVPVWGVARAFADGMNVDEIAGQWPHVLVVDVEEAIRYAMNNAKEIKRDIKDNK